MNRAPRPLHWLLAACVGAALLVGFPLGARAQDDPVRPEVINGGPVPITDVPWQVGLMRADEPDNYYAQFCGGSIIDAEWIVTAAHCVAGSGSVSPADTVQILSGQADLADPGTGGRTDVAAIVVHPDYESWNNANDIALVQLATPLDLSGPTRDAIALPTQDPAVWPAAGTDATISGWGNTSTTDYDYPTALQAGQVDVLTDPTDPACGDYGTPGAMEYDRTMMLCAGTAVSPITDTCQGDSGGPLAVDVGGTWTLAGITSFGEGCADPDFLGVYTRVTSYTAWVAETQALSWREIAGSVSSSNGAVDDGSVRFYSSCAAAWPIATTYFTGGEYQLTVPQGDYRAQIEPENGTGALASWHNAKDSCDTADSVSVGDYPDPHPARDLVAVPGSNVSGTVSSSRGTASAGWVVFYEDCAAADSYASAAFDYFVGTYEVTVPNGTYKVLVEPRGGDGVALSWHSAAADCAGAETVTVSGAGDQDLVGLPGWNVSGRVSTANGPVAEAGVTFVADCTPVRPFSYSAWAITDPEGNYVVTVPTGSYRVEIDPYLVDSDAITSWHADQATCADADEVAVSGDRLLDLEATSGSPPSPAPENTSPPVTTPPVEDQPPATPPDATPDPTPTVSPPSQRLGQTVVRPIKKSKKGKKITLAKTTRQGQPVTWRSTTKKICTVQAARVKLRKKGTCRLIAGAPGSATTVPYTARFSVRVK